MADPTTDLKIAQPLTLQSGLVLPNRLVKAAMAEGMGDSQGLPSQELQRVYSEWSKGGWGMVITGNVQVDRNHMGGPMDVSLISGDLDNNNKQEYQEMLEAWKSWAEKATGKGEKTKAIVQIAHPGRQSPLGAGSRGLLSKTLAPSPIPLNIGTGLLPFLLRSLVFGTPQEMTVPQIRHVVSRFARTARLAAEAGFHGVEVHAAHGYLLAQFLSASSNRRTDEYGGDARGRCQIVVEILEAIRQATNEDGFPEFVVGVKLNSVDHQHQHQHQQGSEEGKDELYDCLEQLRRIITTTTSSEKSGRRRRVTVDFLEISGGSYEDPKFIVGSEGAGAGAAGAEKENTRENNNNNNKKKSARTQAREAFFLEFARAIRRHVPDVPLMVTGGFRTRAGMEAALEVVDLEEEEEEEEEEENSNGRNGNGHAETKKKNKNQKRKPGCDLIGLGRPSVLDPMAANKLLERDHDAKALKIEGPDPKAMPWLLKYLGLHFIGAGSDTVYYVDKLQKIGLPTSAAAT